MLLPGTGLGAFLACAGLASSLIRPVSSLVSHTEVARSHPVRSINHHPGVLVQPLQTNTTLSDHHIPRSDDSTTTSQPCAVEPYESPIVHPQKFYPFNKARATLYRYRQQQAVNLGSWFVHEQWMTPSLFTCASGAKVSELDIASGWGNTGSARALLERHWATFINDTDFERLASMGINTVRLPIGYWNLPSKYTQNTPFESVSAVYKNSWQHVVRAINMAADVGLGVLVDFHGAPGSQNGQPHSGISDGQTNLFTSPVSQEQTINALTFLVQQLANVTNVVGIQILNEPKNDPQLATFYDRALATLRQVSPEAKHMPFYIHDGFDLERFSKYVSHRTDFVVQDHHSYFAYTPEDQSKSATDHTRDVTSVVAASLATASRRQRNNLVVAEWSCALAPESFLHETHPQSARMRFCEAQLEVYRSTTAGWAFWSYSKEDCDNDLGWCFKDAVGKSLPSTFHSYPRKARRIGNDATTVLAELSRMQHPDLTERFTLDYATKAILMAHPSHALVSNPGKRRHRFAAIHSRRRPAPQRVKAARAAMIHGYEDGFTAAMWFAKYGLSKLGFRGQYIQERSVARGLKLGNEEFYRKCFAWGLRNGETLVTRIVREHGPAIA